MSDRPRTKGRHRYFWRSCRYLWPYRSKVTISVVAAFVVGLALAGGLTTMIPIMQVMIGGDTMQSWYYRRTAANRMNVTFVPDFTLVQVATMGSGPAKQAGIRFGDKIVSAPLPPGISPSPFPPVKGDPENWTTTDRTYHAGDILRNIAWTGVGSNQPRQNNIRLTLTDRTVTVKLQRPKWYDGTVLKLIELLPLKPVKAVGAVFCCLAIISLLGNIARYFQEHLSDEAAIFAANDIRQRLYDRVLRIPVSSLGEQGASDVTSRLVTDVDTLQDGFKTILGQSIQQPINALMAFLWALKVNWILTMFIVLLAPLMGLVMKKFGKKMRRASRAALRSSSSLLGQIEGTLVGIRIVKGYNAEKYERRRYGKILWTLIAEQIRMSKIDAFSSPVMEMMILIMAAPVVLVATMMITQWHSIPSTDFIGVMIALAMIAESLRKASKVNNALQKANAAAARLFEIYDILPERQQGQISVASAGNGEIVPRKLPPLKNSIDFQNVVFTYSGASMPALDGVSLRVPKGQSIAIVGRNGSGKTTLQRMLMRFYDPDAGRILIDGVDIRTVSRSSLRDQISLVEQDSNILPGTIAENIAYGEPLAHPQAKDSPQRTAVWARIQDAARRAFAEEFILEKPGGYNMLLEAVGTQLSGGQKQRLCIARAIFHQSPILILDEATSQVDAKSEHLIHEAIEHLIHERTTFVIAHRFSTIISADKIVVMERGQIIGEGKHDDLLNTCPVYQQLYERQLIGAG
jgi:ATP-binding cassette, subfamily B, bacterial MsbA